MKLTAEQIAHLASLEDPPGSLTAQAVVADAKKKTSPLHSLFEWNARRAAELYWLDRAREVIRAVTLVVTTEHVTFRVPKHFHDPDTSRGYVTLAHLGTSPEKARSVMLEELTRVAGNLERALGIAEVLGLHAEIDGLLRQVVGVRRIVVDTAAA
jgi:hypothetical protein